LPARVDFYFFAAGGVGGAVLTGEGDDSALAGGCDVDLANGSFEEIKSTTTMNMRMNWKAMTRLRALQRWIW